jgi:transcriptional regulator with XRE-family HTH domain
MLSEFEIFVIKKVKEFRLQQKLSQADLAEKIDVSSGFIGKVESLKSNSKYNLNHLNKIAKGLNINPKDLFPNTYL